MSDAVLASLITGGISLIGIIITAIWQSHSAATKSEMHYQELLSKLEQQSVEEDTKLHAQIENIKSTVDIRIAELTREIRNLEKKTDEVTNRLPVLEEKAKRTDKRLDILENS